MSKNQRISSDVIYDYVINAIKEGKLKPKDRIKEQDLALETGLSRTPIREALGILLNEGILTQDGKKGLVVAGLDLVSITKLYEMRELLEGEAARLATFFASKVEIEILYNIVNSQKKLNDIQSLRANNILFHETIFRCSNNNYLLKTMQNLDKSLILLGESTLAKPQRCKEAFNEHFQIVNAIEKKDEKMAMDLAKFHIRQAYKVRLERILS
ncbi:GntR family transcriptional regulator [uncultured Campylobacter sp.]|uniref:GntR family transcriptional regulator n=1 Tax=uncultured Campylobacter sp. TaxID=218934 RepID=UPI0026064EF7|nr:GntR family transcriptional regulator [uncultured Campylobacter sp.]